VAAGNKQSEKRKLDVWCCQLMGESVSLLKDAAGDQCSCRDGNLCIYHMMYADEGLVSGRR
jgi:hypothetical protein